MPFGTQKKMRTDKEKNKYYDLTFSIFDVFFCFDSGEIYGTPDQDKKAFFRGEGGSTFLCSCAWCERISASMLERSCYFPKM